MRRELGDLAGHAVREARANGDEKVALGDGHVGVLGAVHAHGAEVERVGAAHGTLAHEGGHHGDLHALGKLGELGAGVAGHDAAAGVEQRPLGLLNELGGLLDLARVAAVSGFVAG